MHCFSVKVNSYTYRFLEATSYEIMVAVPSVLQMKLTFMKLVLRKVHFSVSLFQNLSQLSDSVQIRYICQALILSKEMLNLYLL